MCYLQRWTGYETIKHLYRKYKEIQFNTKKINWKIKSTELQSQEKHISSFTYNISVF